MISAQLFMLANLVMWLAILVFAAVENRRSRTWFRSRHRGVRYRRITSADVLKMIHKATPTPATEKTGDR